MDEEVWGNAITIDNRWPIQAGSCLSLKDQYLQDNVTELAQYLVGFTDGGIAPGGCVQVDNNQPIDTGSLVNQYFNGTLSVLDANGAARTIPLNNTAASGVYNEGNLLAGEIENEGAGFGPQIATYGSLPMTSYSVSSWSSLCATAGTCTISQVVGPDGPNGNMLAAEMDTSHTAADIVIGTDTRATYAGDRYLIWSWGRPGINETNIYGFVGNAIGLNNAFYISAGTGIDFAPTAGNGGNIHACSPGAFGSGLAYNGYSPQVAICTITTGYSIPSAINFHLTATNGATSQTWGNQIAEPGWAFIPGPNNPACTAAGTCNLSADQIEEARRDQYHGFVPPNSTAGQAVTGEPIVVNNPNVASQSSLTYNSGHAPTPGSSTTASWAPDSSGHFTISDGPGAFVKPCTATNGVCAPQPVDCHTACSPTAAQLTNAIVTNYAQTTANVSITGPALTAGMTFLMTVETAQAGNYWRYHSTGANIYLDGSSTPVTNIIFAAPALGNSFSCFVSPNAGFMKCTTLAGTSSSS
jgi:hypothetical protein